MKRYLLLVIINLCSFATGVHGSIADIMQKISLRAYESESTVLMITENSRVIGICNEGRHYEPIETRSITKSFVSLAIGLLMQEGKIASIDTPIHQFFPEWNQGYKKEVTIRNLLSHTSGLQCDEDIYLFPNIVKMALVSDFSNPPNTRFIYNNKAVNLLAAVVERASGMSIHAYLRWQLFQPLGITSDTWLCDTEGNPYGMSHLTMNALDLTKIGILIANGGYWNGQRLLATQWINFISNPSQQYTPFYSQLWWLGYYSLNVYWDDSLIELYEASGIPCEYTKALKELCGRILPFQGHICYGNFVDHCAVHLLPYFGNTEAISNFFTEVERQGLPIARWQPGQLRSLSARGYMGQQLIIFPKEKVVGVRLTHNCGSSTASDNFSELESLIADLIYERYLYNSVPN